MTTINNSKELTTWTEIKDRVYGKKGNERRDNLERETETFKVGLLLKIESSQL